MLVTFLSVVITFASLATYAIIGMNYDVTTQIVTKNPEGTKTALVLYHSGLNDFSHDVANAYADGLVQNGWSVEITTSSLKAPTVLSKYSLLVVLSNTYASTPYAPTTRQLERIGDLNAIQIVLITSGAGTAQESKRALENMVNASNGNIVQSLILYSMAPNDGDKSATEIAYQTAQQLT